MIEIKIYHFYQNVKRFMFARSVLLQIEWGNWGLAFCICTPVALPRDTSGKPKTKLDFTCNVMSSVTTSTNLHSFE